jgi:hypothetical protein
MHRKRTDGQTYSAARQGKGEMDAPKMLKCREGKAKNIAHRGNPADFLQPPLIFALNGS